MLLDYHCAACGSQFVSKPQGVGKVPLGEVHLSRPHGQKIAVNVYFQAVHESIDNLCDGCTHAAVKELMGEPSFYRKPQSSATAKAR